MLSIALFRGQGDLRLHDQPALKQAILAIQKHVSASTSPGLLLPVFCFDPRQWDIRYLRGESEHPSPNQPTSTYMKLPSEFAMPKCDGHRLRFLVESIADLRQQLQRRGSDLLVAFGRPEEVMDRWLQFTQETCSPSFTARMHMQKEISSQELLVERNLQQLSSKYDCSTRLIWGSTLIHPDDVPISINYRNNPNNDGGRSAQKQSRIPDTFSQFRKIAETRGFIRELWSAPDQLPVFPVDLVRQFMLKYPEYFLTKNQQESGNFGDIPVMDKQFVPHPLGVQCPGGETAALSRLNHYVHNDIILNYKETRNESIGMDYSTKFSPYLAHGCLSPRKIYWVLHDYEMSRVGTKSSERNLTPQWEEGPYWLFFELLWRDYFKFVAIEYGSTLFHLEGIRAVMDMRAPFQREWKTDMETFRRWKEGTTGIPWVDAGMRELAATGFLSNRLRQNVASFFVHSLKMDWRLGAAYFESILIDEDTHSNYGNWQYVAGIGNDPKDFRKFNMVKQAKDYDPLGLYVKRWIPELAHLPDGDIALFMPWTIKEPIKNYFQPIIVEKEWERFSGNQNRNRGGRPNQPRRSDWKVKKYNK